MTKVTACKARVDLQSNLIHNAQEIESMTFLRSSFNLIFLISEFNPLSAEFIKWNLSIDVLGYLS